MKIPLAIILFAIITYQSIPIQGQTDNIVQILNKTSEFSTLVDLLQLSNVIASLSVPGPLTVVAPTDEAFNKLPNGTLDNLRKPENRENLTNILKYHVIGQKLTTNDIKALTLPTQIETLLSIQLIVDTSGTNVKINNALVVNPDIGASNGVVHGIDTVIFNPTDIVQTAINAGSYKTLVAAIDAVGLTLFLKAPGHYTIFPPNDTAFAKLNPGVLDDLLKPANKPTLTKIIRHHVTDTLYTTSSIDRLALPINITMLSLSTAQINKNGNDVTINGIVVSKADIFNTNGITHGIDSLIYPPLDVVDTIVTDGKFRNLTTALIAADLISSLQQMSQCTIFAPSDDAFAKLPPGTLENLLKPENVEELIKILKFHVLTERKSSNDIKSLNLPTQLTTLSGLKPIVDRNGENIRLNNATVTRSDLDSTNGLIHEIDTVLLPLTDIIQTTVNDDKLKLFVQMIDLADLNETLRSDGPFSVFVPDDNAFNQLKPGVLVELFLPENKNTLIKLAKYHATNQLITNAAINRLSLPNNITMLTGSSTKLDKIGNTVKINSATVTKGDVFNSNGMIHIIDQVLLPSLNVIETVIIDGNFQNLIFALKKADLFETLQENGSFTVFAPTDTAFNNLPPGYLNYLLKPEHKGELISFLQYHVLKERKTSADIKAMNLPNQLMTSSNTKFIVDVDGDQVKVNEAKITQADRDCVNGLVHVVDTVIVPHGNIFRRLLNETGFATLLELLTSTELIKKLKDGGPFTIFAPTDIAFSKLPESVIQNLEKTENKAVLEKVLSYHVLDGLLTYPSLNRKTLPFNQTMLAGGVTEINKGGREVRVNHARVTRVDLFTDNGIIQVIDQVLIPEFDVFDQALLNGDLRTFVSVLQLAQLDVELQKVGPFTVFAPSDAAFAKLPNGTLDNLLKPENRAKLTRILKYHVVSGQKITSDELDPSKQLDMLDGGSVTISKDGNNITINGNTISTKNIASSNGIIHVIDGVLMPKNTSVMLYQSNQTMLIVFLSMFIYVYRFFL